MWSIAHEFADHGGGHKRFLTGRLPASPVGFVNDAPAVTSIISKMKEHLDRGVPNTAMLAPSGRDHIDVFSFGSAYLGRETHPFIVSGDPAAPPTLKCATWNWLRAWPNDSKTESRCCRDLIRFAAAWTKLSMADRSICFSSEPSNC